MQTAKNTVAPKPNQPMKSERITHRGWIALLIFALAIAFVLGTSSFQIYWSKERRLISAANEIVTALKVYRDASPGTAKEFPLTLTDLQRDPRLLADKAHLATLPVDPITQTQEWGLVRNKNDQIIGVHSLSNEAPTLFAEVFSFRGGEKYSDWKFTAE
jgi:type II secretory pathway pseudopilin PulG